MSPQSDGKVEVVEVPSCSSGTKQTHPTTDCKAVYRVKANSYFREYVYVYCHN